MIRNFLYRILPQRIVAETRRNILLPARRYLGPRIPIAMITGTCGKTTTTRMLAHILTMAGHRVGFTSTDGIVINSEPVTREDAAGYKGAKWVLNDKNITVAVLEVARGDLIRFGLYRDRCQAAALLNVGREQIEMDGIDTVEQMAQLKKQVVDAATGTVVLNADDEQCIRFISLYPIHRLTLFSLDTDNPFIRQHVAKSGIAYVGGHTDTAEVMQRWQGNTRHDILPLSDFPACANGLFPQNTANALAAAALAEGMQVPGEIIRKALGSFETNLELSPGRFNFISGYPQTILIDRAVTVPAAALLATSLEKITVKGSRICMLDGVGNRPDWHFSEVGQLLSNQFDQVICFESQSYRRGRAPGEIARALKDGFVSGGLPAESIHLADDIEQAFDTLTKLVQGGDLIAILLCDSTPRKVLSLLDTSLKHSAV